MKFPINRPGLFVRLGNLIVLQGIFVFLALGLILFYPNHENTQFKNDGMVKTFIQDIAHQVTERYEASDTSVHGDHLWLPIKSITSSEQVKSSGLFALQSNGHLDCVVSLGTEDSLSLNIQTDASISEKIVRFTAKEDTGFYFSVMASPVIEVCYYRPVWNGSVPLVFAASVQNTQVASERAELAYVLFLLFLVSTLVSLLTVYILWKRFKEPLERLSLGLEKSSDGEVYYQILPEGESELSDLAEYANKVVRTLWSSQKEAREYGIQFHEVSKKLVQSRRFLSTLIDSSPSLVIVTNPDGEVIIFNKQARTVFEYEVSEVLNKDVSDLLILPTDIFHQTPLSEQMSFETLCRRKNQTFFPVYSVVAPVRSDEGGVWAYVFILHDISESKSFQEMMVRLDRYSTRGEMAGEIAHEINNFLAIVSGNLELLPLLMRKGDQDKINSKLELMRNTVDKIARFSDNLMDSGGDEITLEATNINQIIENVIAFLKPQNKFDRLVFTTKLEHNLPLLKTDHSQMQQLLVNLFNNSADVFFESKGNGEISIATRKIEDNGDSFVRITISDNGPGVQADKVDFLFVKRFTTKRRGHGIGLITCKKIVEHHKGKVSYTYDHGAAFMVDLPVIISDHIPNETMADTAMTEIPAAQV